MGNRLCPHKTEFRAVQRSLFTLSSQAVHVNASRNTEKPSQQLLLIHRDSVTMGFPGGSAGKESTCNAGDLGSIPGLGRSSGEGNIYLLQYSGLENPMDCIVHEVSSNIDAQGLLSHPRYIFDCLKIKYFAKKNSLNVINLITTLQLCNSS